MVTDRVEGKCVLSHSHYKHCPHPRVTDMPGAATPVLRWRSVSRCSFLLNCFLLSKALRQTGSLHVMKHDKKLKIFEGAIFLPPATYT